MLARSSTPAVRAAAAPAKGARSFFAAKASSQSYQYALDEEFPGVPKAAAKAATAAKPTVATSTTAAGLKLASDDGAPLVASLGVEIKAGSRTETDETAGLSQLFAKMAFRATDARSDLRLYRDVEALGGVVHKRAGRDFVRYSISVLPHQLERAAAILAETTLAPRFAQWDIETIKKQVAIDAHASAACSERTVFENVHGAAFYDDVSLGRPQFSLDNLAAFSTDDLAAFYEQYVNTAGLALVGSGVDHATLTSVANEFFAGVPAAAAPLAKAPATYVGGESRVKKNGVKNTYVALGFPTAGAKDAGAARVLEALLTQRLRSKKAAGFQATYEDAGLVGLRGFAAPADAGALVDKFAAEIKKVASAAPSIEELAAAKTAAVIAVADEVYSREGKLAFLGAAAHAQAVATPFANVEAVSAKAVQELAQKAVASRPALASVGKLAAVPRLDALINKLK